MSRADEGDEAASREPWHLPFSPSSSDQAELCKLAPVSTASQVVSGVGTVSQSSCKDSSGSRARPCRVATQGG